MTELKDCYRGDELVLFLGNFPDLESFISWLGTAEGNQYQLERFTRHDWESDFRDLTEEEKIELEQEVLQWSEIKHQQDEKRNWPKPIEELPTVKNISDLFHTQKKKQDEANRLTPERLENAKKYFEELSKAKSVWDGVCPEDIIRMEEEKDL